MATPLPSGPAAARPVLVGLFVVALALHLFLATRNWHSGFLIGHEFRQTLTAINTHYIDAQDNFTPRYESPVLGKPWVIPLEFPLYEWSVAGLSRLTGWPHFQSARTISLTCFYLCLPAVFLLLGHCGVSPPRRLLVLALILTCPLYIFYSRAFLMESMELMCSVWFLLAFVRTMERRHAGWLLFCALSGTGAALIKNTTFFVWLLPAAAFGAWCLWTDLRRRAGPRAIAATLAWGLGTVVAPATALLAWIRFTDAIKATHASAHILTSTSLSTDNFQLYNLLYRLTPGNWSRLMARWDEAIMPPWIIGAVLALSLWGAPAARRQLLLALVCFLAGQSLFPNAYAHHDYYFYACAFFVLAALGFGLLGLLDSHWPRWLVWLIALVPAVAGLNTYRQSYATWQNVRSAGGSGLTEAIKAYTPPGSVIIIAGANWVPIIPYYSQRKALMIRNGLEWDWAYQDRAYGDLAGEDVSALVLVGDQRTNDELRRRTVARFGLDDAATFTHYDAEVYLNRRYRENAVLRLRQPHGLDGIATTARPVDQTNPLAADPTMVAPGVGATVFPMMSPAPVSYRMRFGLSVIQLGAHQVLGAHPDSELTFAVPPGATRLECVYGILPEAYDKGTNGVSFSAAWELPDGGRREIYRRLLSPSDDPRDRGDQSAKVALGPIPAGARLVLLTGTNGNENFDWAYWGEIRIH